MKFTEILQKFHILPLYQSELVQSEIIPANDGSIIVLVRWFDSDTYKTHIQMFADQDIQVADIPGHFSVATLGRNERVGFVALTLASLE